MARGSVDGRVRRHRLLELKPVETLDNMMWHALNGPQDYLAEGNDRARRYPIDIGPFCAVPDEPTAEDYAALRDLVGPGNVATILRDEVVVPEGWDVLATIDVVQMIGPTAEVVVSADPRIVVLEIEDVEEMMSLTARTKPGPFATRTWELGTYLGIRIDGRLIAMAGQRAQTAGHVEISAVCTDEEFVGRGLGSVLLNAQINAVVGARKVPMLHAAANNARAISLYERMGFSLRRRVRAVVMRSPE